jgi:uncharacterized protein involved in exopolysaccharide biosynthesis
MMAVPREPESDVHLREYLRVVRRHRWLVTGVFLVSVVTAAVWTFLQVPIFQASATVLIDPEPPRVLNIQDVTQMGAPTQDYYQTQYEIIKSRAVLARAIESLNLKVRMPELAAAPDPEGAQVANGVAGAYVKYNLDLKLKGARDALAWLNEQMAELKAKVQESSTALQNYRVKAGILGLEEQRKITAQKIMDFNKAYLEAQAQRLSIEAKLNELRRIARDRSGAQTIFTVADNPLIQKLKEELADLEVERSKLLKTFREKHPEVVKIDAKIQQLREKIDAEIQTMLRGVQTEYQVARAREETLLANVNQLRREGQDLNEKEIQYLTLQRETESNQQLYEAVLKRLKETGISGGLETNNVRIVQEATVPSLPIRPRKTLNLLLSVAVGLVAGVAAAFVVEYFDTTVRSPEEVERRLGLPVIGIVPSYSVKR